MKRRIINLFSKNLGLKAASLVIATVLWIVVVSVDDPVTSRVFSQIPIEFINAQTISDMGLVYENTDNVDVVSATVWAKRSILDSLSRDNFRAVADLSKLDGGMIPLEIRATKYADRIEDVNQARTQIRIDTEKLLDKQFKIELIANGQAADGCIVGKLSSDVRVVKVSGPESIVDRITKAQAIVTVDGVSDDIVETVNIQFNDNHGDAVESEMLTSSADKIAIEVSIWQSKRVPLVFGYVGVPADGYGVSGSIASTLTEVDISGESDRLAEINQIVIPPSVIDVTGAKEDVSVTIPISAYMPGDVRLASDDEDETATVTVTIRAHETKTVLVPIANVSVINVPEGMVAEMGGLSELIPVEINGLLDVLDGVNPELIKGTIDMAKNPEAVDEGVFSAPVDFVFPEGISGGKNSIEAQIVLKSETVNND